MAPGDAFKLVFYTWLELRTPALTSVHTTPTLWVLQTHFCAYLLPIDKDLATLSLSTKPQGLCSNAGQEGSLFELEKSFDFGGLEL